MRTRRRILLGAVSMTTLLGFGAGAYPAHAATPSRSVALGPTNAQAGYLHPASSYTPPANSGITKGIDCGISNPKCLDLELYRSIKAYGHYVGHDEPANEFMSSIPGSGNQYRTELQLPSDPATQPTRSNGVAWNFQLHAAPWFGMAICNNQSFPEHDTTTPCVPNSDSNIADCADSTGATCTSTTGPYIGNHVGSAYMEFQFYPPGFAPQFPNETTGGISCDAKLWCAAMVIWSLQNAADGTNNNADCVNNSNGGVEFGNYAFLTHSGHSPIAAQPYKNPNAFFPNTAQDMYFNSGDKLVVTMHDVPDMSPGPNGSGLEIDVNDLTTGENGSMVASGTGPNNNGFGTLKWDPTANACTVIPYNFHPMYSTSGLHTRVPWAAHTYNVAFTDEIGHFDYCGNTASGNGSGVSAVNSAAGGCAGGFEGPTTDAEAAESPPPSPGEDDSVCYDGTLGQSTTLVPLPGCIGSNLPGFDGASYLPASSTFTATTSTTWPNGSANLPTPIRFTSPLTGPNYDQNYSDQAFENNLPALEFVSSLSGGASSCSIATGAGCTGQPPTDDWTSAKPEFGFYPYFSIDTHNPSQCWWLLGQDVPGQTSNDFNGGVGDSQYGQSGVAAVPYNVPFQQAVSQGLPPVTSPLVEDFHTLDPANTDSFGPYAQPNPCASAAITFGAVTPEVPLVPTLVLAGSAAAFWGRRRLRSRRQARGH